MYSQEKINELVSQVKEASQPDKIYLFGSYASGKAKDSSDIDLCIIKNGLQDKQKELSKIKKTIFGLAIPVDILLFEEAAFDKRKNIWGSVQYEISRNGKVVYEK